MDMKKHVALIKLQVYINVNFRKLKITLKG